MGQYQTFIVRFWSDDANADMLRGHIQHIASGRGLYFRTMERMLRFMDDHRMSRALASEESSVTDSEGGDVQQHLPIDFDRPTNLD